MKFANNKSCFSANIKSNTSEVFNVLASFDSSYLFLKKIYLTQFWSSHQLER